MLNTAALIAFAATSDAEAAKTFYRDVLKLSFVADEPFALVFDANGTILRIQKVPSVVAVPYTVLGWKVENIDTINKLLSSAGVEFERYPHIVQDEHGIMQFPDGTRVGWFKDPDGNLLSVTQLPG